MHSLTPPSPRRAPRLLAALAGALVLAPGAAVALGAAPAAADSTGVVGGEQLAGPGLVFDRGAGVPRPPTVEAISYVVADADTGAVLAAKAPHLRLRPASTLKTLTALSIMPRLDPAAVHVATDADVTIDGSRVGLVPRASYTVAQLWQGLFLDSGNDATTALANQAGGIARTVTLMRDEAWTLHAHDTTVVNPTGLDAPNQWSSAYDLALFGRAGLAVPAFRAYVSTVSVPFPGHMPAPGKHRQTYMIYNQNRLLGVFPGAIGVKTGYTTLARNTYIGAATRDGHTYIVTLMDSGPTLYKQATALLTWAFDHGSAVRPVGTLVTPGDPPAVPTPVVKPVGAAGAGAPVAALRHSGGLRLPNLWAWAGAGVLALLVSLRVGATARRRRRRSRFSFR